MSKENQKCNVTTTYINDEGQEVSKKYDSERNLLEIKTVEYYIAADNYSVDIKKYDTDGTLIEWVTDRAVKESHETNTRKYDNYGEVSITELLLKDGNRVVQKEKYEYENYTRTKSIEFHIQDKYSIFKTLIKTCEYDDSNRITEETVEARCTDNFRRIYTKMYSSCYELSWILNIDCIDCIPEIINIKAKKFINGIFQGEITECRSKEGEIFKYSEFQPGEWVKMNEELKAKIESLIRGSTTHHLT